MSHAAGVTIAPAYRRTNTTLSNRIARAVWGLAWLCLFRPSPRPLHAWRSALLRLFGAQLGRSCYIYAGARIWAPWNLVCGDCVAIADGVEVYNPAPVTLGDHAVVSQGAWLCGASHDYDDAAFPMIQQPIRIGAYAWVGGRATVQMGVSMGEGAVLALGAVATRDLDAWGVYAGVPAQRIKSRKRIAGGENGARANRR